MSDDVKQALEWLRTLLVPGWPSWDHANTLLAHIDGEPARLAAAVAREREEQREACAQSVEIGYRYMAGTHAAAVRATPLTATPLADENKALRGDLASALAGRDGFEAIATQCTRERDGALARVKELEANSPEAARYWKREYDAEYARRLAVEDLSRTTCDRYLTDVGLTEHVLCCNKESSKRVASLAGERDALKTQLADAETELRELRVADECGPATDSPECSRGAEANWCRSCLLARYRFKTRELAEAVKVLRALLREEWYTYEGNLEASGHASVDDLNAARAFLAKVKP